MRHQVARGPRRCVRLCLRAVLVAAPFLLFANLSSQAHADTLSSGKARDAAMDAEDAGKVAGIPTGGLLTSAPSQAATTPTTDAPLPGAAPVPKPAPAPAVAPTPAAVVQPVSVPAPAPPPAAPAPAAPAPAPAAAPAADPAPVSTGHLEVGNASWYDTVPGTCASRLAPRGAELSVTNVSTGATTSCRVADYGPTDQRRIIDLSRTTFSQIGDPSMGLMLVRVEW